MNGLAPAAEAVDDPLELAAYTRWLPGPERVAESSLRLAGMHCAACAGTIEAALRRVAGVADAHVSAAAKGATVRWDPARTRVSALIGAIEAAGYGAVPDSAAAARLQRRAEARQALWRFVVAAFCSMQVMMLAAPAYFSAAGDLAPDHKRLLDAASWLLTLPVMCFSAGPFFGGAWRALRRRRIGMDVPVALGIAVAFCASSAAAFDPSGPFGAEVYFDSLTMFIAFLLGGRWLELRTRHRAEQALEDATQRLPQTALRIGADGRVETVSARRVQRGDRLRVPVGQAFAADGIVVEGTTEADESLLTGEARPVAKAVGDAVAGGSLNLGAPVEMRVERAGADTRYEAIVALMRAARTQRPAMLAAADRWAAPFVWAVLVLAAGAAAAWSAIDPARAVWVAVSVLVVTCPCALSLAAPSALLAAAGALGRRGVLLRRLDAIQALARVQTLFIDKTGTLTEPRMQCIAVERCDGVDEPIAALRCVAAALAAWSSHPLAAVLRELDTARPCAWREVRELAGAGIEGIDDSGDRWRLGSAAYAGAAPVNGGATQTWLARNGRPLARFVFDERLRPDAAEAIAALQADGVTVHLLSGDDAVRAQALAARLGISCGDGALTPDGKLAALREAQQRGEIVAMVGDGINDAPVLAQADVSLAMGEGAAVAQAQGDAILTRNRLMDIVLARRVSRRAVRVVRQNMLWAAVYNLACVPLALVGWLPPWAAGLGMATSSLIVVANSLRLAR
jgi:Cu2+-exporting ATPase